ncbi:unnamed protein product [Rhodiola kirilowii]
MIHALKSLKPQSPYTALRARTGREPTRTRFIQATPNSNQNHQAESTMEGQQDNKPDQCKKNEDVMSHSFGEGYKTRSDEEGFGGVYGGNQSEEEEELDVVDVNHVLHPEYDKSQGSEVKEKEKARNQMDASS